MNLIYLTRYIYIYIYSAMCKNDAATVIKH